MANEKRDSAMQKAQTFFKKSELSLEELGLKMGYEPGVARRAAWQFLSKTADPRISMLRRFARAIGVPIEELIAENHRAT